MTFKFLFRWQVVRYSWVQQQRSINFVQVLMLLLHGEGSCSLSLFPHLKPGWVSFCFKWGFLSLSACGSWCIASIDGSVFQFHWRYDWFCYRVLKCGCLFEYLVLHPFFFSRWERELPLCSVTPFRNIVEFYSFVLLSYLGTRYPSSAYRFRSRAEPLRYLKTLICCILSPTPITLYTPNGGLNIGCICLSASKLCTCTLEYFN